MTSEWFGSRYQNSSTRSSNPDTYYTSSDPNPNSFFTWSPIRSNGISSPVGVNGLSPHEDDIVPVRQSSFTPVSPIGMEPVSPVLSGNSPFALTPPINMQGFFNNASDRSGDFAKILNLSPSSAISNTELSDDELDSFLLPPSAISEHEEFIMSMGGMDDLDEHHNRNSSLPSYSNIAARNPTSTLETSMSPSSHLEIGPSPSIRGKTLKSPLSTFHSKAFAHTPQSPSSSPIDNSPSSSQQIFNEHPYGEHPSRTLFVRNINSNVEDQELRNLFETYGPIRSMYTQCKHRGFVMISYFDIRHAKAAMRNLQGKQLRRRKLDIHYSIPKDNPSEKDQNQGTLVVFNLDPTITSDELREIFGVYGEIKEIRETPNKKHHKFIEFYDVREAENAMKQLNKTEIKSKKIKIEPSRPGGRKANGLLSPTREEFSQNDSNLNFFSEVQLSQSAPVQPAGDFGHAPRGKLLNSPVFHQPQLATATRTTSLPHASTKSEILEFKSPNLSAILSPPTYSSPKAKEDDRNQFALNIDAVKNGIERRTTLMIKNIPNKYTQKMLLSTVDEAHKGLYDFFYLPIDFKNKCNVGYAFINFIDPVSIVSFYEKLHHSKWEKFNSEKVCEITFARIQGKDALIAHFQNSSLMCEDKKCRPIIFHSDGPNVGQQAPFPVGPNVRTRDNKISTPRRKEDYRTSGKSSKNGGKNTRSRSYSSKN